jgi:hypothetical protein
MESISIPPLVEFIDGSAFRHTKLKVDTITLSTSYFAFRDHFLVDRSQTRLIAYFDRASRLIIPSHATQIAARCFCSCDYLRSVSFESDCAIVRLEEELFSESILQSIVLPTSVEILGQKCFQYCRYLTSVSFESPSRLRRIEEAVFDSCTTLNEIRIPASIEILCSRCFQGCSCLKSIVFESRSQLQCIESEVFAHCRLLSFIDLPGSIERLSPEWDLRSSICTVRFESLECLRRLIEVIGEVRIQVRLSADGAECDGVFADGRIEIVGAQYNLM